LLFNPHNKNHVKLYDRFGLYLFREQHYDFPLAWNSDDKSETKAYFLLHEGGWDYTSVLPIGIVVFEKRCYPGALPEWWAMWGWIHPFQRGRGVLSRVWTDFKEEFGDFKLQPPISWGMMAFLEKQKAIEAGQSALTEYDRKRWQDRHDILKRENVAS
jgi:hypothetical protein